VLRILITGASIGLGRVLAEEFAVRQHKVGLMARSEVPLRDLCRALNAESASGKRAYYHACDLTHSGETKRAITELVGDMGGVDVLINNASYLANKDLLAMTADEWRRSLTTAVDAAFHCTQAVVPHFLKKGGGHIINISSLSTRIVLERGSSYAAAKHALNGFSASVVHELHGQGVKVCLIYPGAFVEDAGQSDWKMPASEVFRACEYAINAHPRAFVQEIVVRPINWPE
jgi:short-subunit dehydrogenase